MTADVVVIGSGINGLVAAAELAGSGRSVCLIEAADRLGGFLASDELTLPGFVHDTYSSWHPLFVTGGAYATLGEDLHRHGLEYANADDAVTGSVSGDGPAVVAHRDPARTVEQFSERDRAAYLAMLDRIGGDLDVIGALLGNETRAPGVLGHAATMLRRGLGRTEGWVRDAATSGRRWGRRTFEGSEVDQLWAPWLLHAGLSPDSASGGLMIPVFAATMHGAGLPVAVGGQRAFLDAFASLLAERGVEVLTGSPVDRILVESGRAAGVMVGGRRIDARQAVLASVTPTALYCDLLPESAVPEAVRAEARGYQYGRAAMQVHVALDEPLEWSDPALDGAPLVHLTAGSDSVGVACAQAEAGLLPARPTVVVGQQALIDPSRVPAGRGMLWLQLQEVPFAPVGDAAGELDTSAGWTDELVTGYVDRVLGLVEEAAPGTRDAVLAVSAISPVDLAAANPNAVQGDPYCGAAELDQNIFWRPGPLTARHRTAVDGLWHIGAATHPGPGLGGGSGHLVAQELLKRDDGALTRVRRLLGR